MRAGSQNCAPQHTLSPEAASVLNSSLILANRRGHAQLTPLHVAATLLASSSSSKASFFKRACIKSHHLHQPNTNYSTLTTHYSQALELCFNVALNRLPATSSNHHYYLTPSRHVFLSNALVAALKRAQGFVKRGCCVEQQQNVGNNVGGGGGAVRVELEQLVLSILDDPSVSRVMKEAGFSSTLIKMNLEDSFSSTDDEQSPFVCVASYLSLEDQWRLKPVSVPCSADPGLSFGGSSALGSRIPRAVARFRRQKKPCCHDVDGNELKISLSLGRGDKRKADYDPRDLPANGEVRKKQSSRAFDLNAEASVDEGEEHETSSSDLTLEDRES